MFFHFYLNIFSALRGLPKPTDACPDTVKRNKAAKLVQFRELVPTARERYFHAFITFKDGSLAAELLPTSSQEFSVLPDKLRTKIRDFRAKPRHKPYVKTEDTPPQQSSSSGRGRGRGRCRGRGRGGYTVDPVSAALQQQTQLLQQMMQNLHTNHVAPVPVPMPGQWSNNPSSFTYPHQPQPNIPSSNPNVLAQKMLTSCTGCGVLGMNLFCVFYVLFFT